MRMTRERWATICFWLALAVMLIVGRYTYQDYGLTVDENVERQSAFISYQYAAEKLFGVEINVYEDDPFEWKDRYYGVALQMPMVAVEHLTGFTMPVRDAFLLRHLYTFMVSMAGWVCFYFFCRKVFHSGWLALLGFLMGTLYPRFWGEQFTNIKDMIFMATCSASLLCIALCLEKDGKWRYEFLSALVFALCANTRFIGLMFPVLLFGYRILRDLLEGVDSWGTWMRKKLLRYCTGIAVMFVCYFAVAPVSWSDPIGYLKGVFGTFSNYTGYAGQVPFLGQFYKANQLPWYYLTVWILLSVPVWYLALIAGGLLCSTVRLTASLKKPASIFLGQQRYFLLCAVVAFVPLLTPAFKEITLYTAWRHVYYIFPSLIVIALFGVQALWKKMDSRRMPRVAVVLTACVLLCGQVLWTVENHPFEKIYFNVFGRPIAQGMDRDYWTEADYAQVQTILRNDPTPRIHLAGDVFTGRTVSFFLPENEMKRFYVWYGYPENVEYIIDTADTPQLQLFDGYTPVYQLRMKDGLLLSTIHLREDVLQDRFGGVYPEYNILPEAE